MKTIMTFTAEDAEAAERIWLGIPRTTRDESLGKLRVFVRDNSVFCVDVDGCCQTDWHNRLGMFFWDRGSAWEEVGGGWLDRVAIFDREDIPSFSLFKVATPKSEFPQSIAGVRVVGLRVMASRLGGNPS